MIGPLSHRVIEPLNHRVIALALQWPDGPMTQ
jgi:hypothetical protein